MTVSGESGPGRSSDAPADRGGRRDADGPADVVVRRATPDDRVAVLRVVEGALLDVDADRVREGIAAGEVLVAVAGTGTVVGALVRDGEHLLAVAVRRRRRRRGIGRALVERALGTTGRLTAAFGPRVRGFYEALGFEVGPRSSGGPAGGGGVVTGADRDVADDRAADAGGGTDGAASDRLRGVRTE